MLSLYPPQQKSHDSLVAALKKHNAALDSSITGAGKTLVAVETAATMRLTPLVICPKVVIPSWKSTLNGQDMDAWDVINYEKLRTGNTRWLKKVGRSFEWNVPENTLLIFDEVHRCKGLLSKNALMLVTATRQNIPRLLLSATAAEDPSEMRALGFALGLHKDTNFTNWAVKRGCSINPWRQLEFPIKSRPKLMELHAEIYPDKGYKISRAEMGGFFAETSIITDPVDFGSADEMQAIYNEMEAELDELSKQSGADKGASALTARLRARQAIELLRIPALAEMVQDAVEEGCSCAVFLNFRASMDALEMRLKNAPATIHGGQTADDRQQNIEWFQNDTLHVILCQINAGGAGVSLHDINGGRPRRSFISPSDDAKMMVQALGRIDRAGSQSDTVQRILFAAGTIEEEVARNFRRKLHNMQTLHADLPQDAEIMKILPNGLDVAAPSDNVVSNTMIADTMELPKVDDSAGLTRGESPTPIQPTAAPPAHAKWSPSKLKHVEVCPGYESREGGVNPAAEAGTRIHEALEKFDLDMLTDSWERLLGERCLEAYQNIVSRHVWEGCEYETHHEVRLEINLGEGLDTFGTCDVLLIHGLDGIAIDWKTGKGAIDDASINTQAQAYVLGAFQRHPTLRKIHFYFVIPQRDEITFHTYAREDCDRIKLRLSTIIRRAEQFQYVWKGRGGVPVEMFNPQPGNCEFCANQWKCHAVTAKVFDIARKYGTDGLTVPAKVHGSETDDPEDMSKLLLLLPVVQQWIDGVKSRSKQMAFEEGLEIPGFEAKERAGRRTITSASAAWHALVELQPEIGPEDFIARLGPISFNEAAEVVKESAPRGKKTAAQNTFEDKLIEMGVLEQAPPSQYLAIKR
jgi:superfamily II DNA or RNA helicase